jgi:hypothetical protein
VALSLAISACAGAQPDNTAPQQSVSEPTTSAPLEPGSGPQGSRVSGELLELVDEASQAQDAAPDQPFQSANPVLLLNEDGTAVAVRIVAENINEIEAALLALGFETLGSRPDLNFIEGFLPIEQIPNLESLSDLGLLGAVAIPRPQTG